MAQRDELVGTREAAALLGVCVKTVRMWGAAGRLAEQQAPAGDDSAGQDSAGRERLYKRKDLERLLRELHRPPPRGKRRR